MSGIFKFAKQQGFFDGVNPVQDTTIPKGRESAETHAYSLEEITQILIHLPEPAATIFATAAFTGARRGEISGMLWENYQDGVTESPVPFGTVRLQHQRLAKVLARSQSLPRSQKDWNFIDSA